MCRPTTVARPDWPCRCDRVIDTEIQMAKQTQKAAVTESEDRSPKGAAGKNAPPAGTIKAGAPAPAPAPRRTPGVKEVIPLAWKLVGTSAGTPVTLLKSIDRKDAEAQMARLELEGYYRHLAIYPVEDEVPLSSSLARARKRAMESARSQVGARKASLAAPKSAKSTKVPTDKGRIKIGGGKPETPKAEKPTARKKQAKSTKTADRPSRAAKAKAPKKATPKTAAKSRAKSAAQGAAKPAAKGAPKPTKKAVKKTVKKAPKSARKSASKAVRTRKSTTKSK